MAAIPRCRIGLRQLRRQVVVSDYGANQWHNEGRSALRFSTLPWFLFQQDSKLCFSVVFQLFFHSEYDILRNGNQLRQRPMSWGLFLLGDFGMNLENTLAMAK